MGKRKQQMFRWNKIKWLNDSDLGRKKSSGGRVSDEGEDSWVKVTVLDQSFTITMPVQAVTVARQRGDEQWRTWKIHVLTNVLISTHACTHTQNRDTLPLVHSPPGLRFLMHETVHHSKHCHVSHQSSSCRGRVPQSYSDDSRGCVKPPSRTFKGTTVRTEDISSTTATVRCVVRSISKFRSKQLVQDA